MQPGTSISSTSYVSQNNHPNVAVRTLIDKEKARINPPQLPPQSPLVTIGDDLGAVMQRQPAVQPKGEPVVRLPPAFFGATQAVLQSWFTVFDTDRDGRINTMQLQQALEAGGLTFSLKTVSSIMRLFDTNNSMTLVFGGFVKVQEFLRSLQRTFSHYGQAKVSLPQLHEALKAQGFKLDMQPGGAFYTLAQSYDYNRDGRIGFDAFIDMVLQLRNAQKVFGLFDAERKGRVLLDFHQLVWSMAQI